MQLHNAGTFPEDPDHKPENCTKKECPACSLARAKSRSQAVVPSLDSGLTGGLRVTDCSCSYPYKSDITVLKKVSLEVRCNAPPMEAPPPPPPPFLSEPYSPKVSA